MQIWIVEESSGSYEDFRSWPVRSFRTKEAAEEWIGIHQPLHEAAIKKNKEDWKAWEAERKAIKGGAVFSFRGTLTTEESKSLDELFERRPEGEYHEQWGYRLIETPFELQD